jgi:hypothetical protein
MADLIQAIETRYAGYRFRSRLEARWAVTLDAAGLTWQYEPEGFETTAGRYLPDFRVTDQYGTVRWLDLKPESYVTTAADADRWIEVAGGTGKPLVVSWGLDHLVMLFTPGAHAYTHYGFPGFVDGPSVAAGKSARFEFGESGAAR